MTSVKFIHTADWHLGKPFAGVDDPQKRALLQNMRFAAIHRMSEIAKECNSEFVVVSGDLFDSPSASKSTVSAACSAIGSIGVPVYVIPGNHDHGGPGCLWKQDFFEGERKQLATNLHVLLTTKPVELDNAVLFPCPLLQRHDDSDPTTWLRTLDAELGKYGNKARIVIAHGSVQDFTGIPDDEDQLTRPPNLIDLELLNETDFDFIALGDWHGTKQVGSKAWYSGTQETDRFYKGSDYNPGNVLAINAERDKIAEVEVVSTSTAMWHDLSFCFSDDLSLDALAAKVDDLIGTRVNADLLHLHLEGSLSIAAISRLEQMLVSWTARLIRIKLENQTTISPSDNELDEMVRRSEDPLIASVAARLVAQLSADEEESNVARVALRELYAACHSK